MPIYNIAGIILDFTFHYQAFFKNNIEKYRVSDSIKADYKMQTEICESIDLPVGVPVITFRNRSIFKTEKEITIVVTDKQGDIKELIKHTIDYKTIHIKLSKKLKEQLAELEYVLTGMIFLELATLEDRLPIHGSAFMVHDEAIIISASSGTGKTTHANHWKTMITPFTMINDDKPLIHMKDHRFYVSGTPWSGKTKANTNITVPLKMIVFYHQGASNQIKEITSDSKLKHLMNHALRPRGEHSMNHALQIMDALIRYSPMIEYHAVDSPLSVKPLYQKIYGGSL